MPIEDTLKIINCASIPGGRGVIQLSFDTVDGKKITTQPPFGCIPNPIN